MVGTFQRADEWDTGHEVRPDCKRRAKSRLGSRAMYDAFDYEEKYDDSQRPDETATVEEPSEDQRVFLDH
jgi:hypothetical protein